MKVKIFMSIFMLGLTFCCKSNQPTSDEQIVNMLRDFYTSYISENAKMHPNTAKIDSIKAKCCTSNLIHELEEGELDYDPFLRAQDSNTEWLLSLIITKDHNENNLYHISYLDTYSGTHTEIKLLIIKEDDGYYKINSIF